MHLEAEWGWAWDAAGSKEDAPPEELGERELRGGISKRDFLGLPV